MIIPCAAVTRVAAILVASDLSATVPTPISLALGRSTHGPDMIALMFRALVFFALITSAFASATLDVLERAAASFSVAIQRLLEMRQVTPPKLAEKTIPYA
jgi:hypothetical protein